MTKFWQPIFRLLIPILIIGCFSVALLGGPTTLFASEIEVVIETLSDSPLVISEEFSNSTPNIPTVTPAAPSAEGNFSTQPLDTNNPLPLVISNEFQFQTEVKIPTDGSPLAISDELTFKTLAKDTPPGGGGGGGSSGGSGGGRIPITELPVLPTSCPTYLQEFVKFGAANNPAEVRKLQSFLRDYESFDGLAVNGVYDEATMAAVMIFQMRYREAILTPWGIDYPTGYVFITTRLAINNLYCERDPANTLDLRHYYPDYPVQTLPPLVSPPATSTATTTPPAILPEFGATDQNLNFWQVAALGLLDFIHVHPWWWLLFIIILILLIVFELKPKKEEDS